MNHDFFGDIYTKLPDFSEKKTAFARSKCHFFCRSLLVGFDVSGEL